MTDDVNDYSLTEVFEKWVQYAIDNGEDAQFITNMVIQQQAALQRMADYESTLTLRHHSGAMMPALPNPTETPLGEMWQDIQDAKGLDKFGNKASDYTRTGSNVDSYHAQSIGWKYEP